MKVRNATNIYQHIDSTYVLSEKHIFNYFSELFRPVVTCAPR